MGATATGWEPRANTTSNWRQVSMRLHLTAESLCTSVPDPVGWVAFKFADLDPLFFVNDLHPIFHYEYVPMTISKL